jgi:hypothetical protein
MIDTKKPIKYCAYGKEYDARIICDDLKSRSPLVVLVTLTSGDEEQIINLNTDGTSSYKEVFIKNIS